MADSEDSASDLIDDQGLADETGAPATAADPPTSSPQSETRPTVPAPAAPPVVAKPTPTPAPVPASTPAPVRARARPEGDFFGGTVQFFNQARGLGSIRSDAGEEIFVHAADLRDDIREGDTVRFHIEQRRKSKVAIYVELVR
jgi:cold shock CspA family protein